MKISEQDLIPKIRDGETEPAGDSGAGSTETSSPSAVPGRIPINIAGFSGPLDLLVHLISKHEMDVFTVSISAITDEFLRQIRDWKDKNLDLAGEFLVLSAALIRYKSRALLPKEEVMPEEEEITDQILEERRQEYERFRKLADELRMREEESQALFPRIGPSPEGTREVIEYTEVSVYDLYRTFQRILEEIGTDEVRLVAGETYSVDEKMLEIEALIAHNLRISLSLYLKSLQVKLEVIVVFLAILELIRLKEIRAFQDQTHGEIFLEKGEKIVMSNE